MSTAEKKNLPGGVTELQLNKWKSQYGEVKLISVPLDDEGKNHAHGYFRKPDLDIIAAASKFAQDEPFKSGNVLFENCFLGGDPEIKNDDECKMSAIVAMKGIFKVRVAVIKNV